ncbi:MAG: transcriptional regulator [Pseudolabrys sp.]
MLAVTKKRRNRYYRIASPLVAKMLESIKAVAALETPPRYQPRSAQDDALRFARTCYDHLAGRLGVAIADALVRKRYVVLSDEGGELTVAGKRFLSGFGSAIMPSGSSRIFCRPCLDWSERRYHIAGHVGAEICRCCLERGWLVRQQGSRAIRLTAVGRRGLRQVFGIEPPDMR